MDHTLLMTYREIKNQIEADDLTIDQINANIEESFADGQITTTESRELETMLEQ